MYLLDTNVISELRRARPHGAVTAWFETVHKGTIRIPAAAIGEIQAGIEITRKQDKERARELELWLERVLAYYEVIPMDAAIFREWSKLVAYRSQHLFLDGMIAATARVYRLTVVTRNTRDFEGFEVELLNPFLLSDAERK